LRKEYAIMQDLSAVREQGENIAEVFFII